MNKENNERSAAGKRSGYDLSHFYAITFEAVITSGFYQISFGGKQYESQFFR